MAASRNGLELYQDAKCDLGTFVVSVERLKRLARPVLITIRLIISIIRWRYPLRSIIVIPVSCLMIIFKAEYVMVVTLFSFPLILLSVRIKQWGSKNAKLVDYQHLFKRKDESPDLILKQATIMKAKQHMDLYLVILIEIQDFCNDLSEKLEFFYGLVNWKRTSHTLLFLLIFLALTIGIFCVELKYFVAGIFLFSCIFNTGFVQAIKDGFNFLYTLPLKLMKPTKVQSIDAFDEVKPEEIPADLGIQFKEQDLFEENEAELSSSTDSDDLREKQEMKDAVYVDEDQSRQRERSGLSFVSKFASSTLASFTRRRRKHGGNCTSCSVEFSTILKKRNYCRHCGNSYCSKCCNQRVPKVVFGATAPAAYEERVLVCQSCYSFLMNRIKGTNTEIVE